MSKVAKCPFCAESVFFFDSVLSLSISRGGWSLECARCKTSIIGRGLSHALIALATFAAGFLLGVHTASSEWGVILISVACYAILHRLVLALYLTRIKLERSS